MQRDAPLRVGESDGQLAIAYIVKAWPRLSETFILNEIIGLERRGVSIRIFSVKDPNPGPIHDRVALVRANGTYLSLRSHWKVALPANFRSLRRRPARYVRGPPRPAPCPAPVGAGGGRLHRVPPATPAGPTTGGMRRPAGPRLSRSGRLAVSVRPFAHAPPRAAGGGDSVRRQARREEGVGRPACGGRDPAAPGVPI